MSAEALPLLSVAELAALAKAEQPGRCATCATLACPGWESVPSTFGASVLMRVGTLRREEDDEPTVVEHHPRGTHGWSIDAPIAPAFFPTTVAMCGFVGPARGPSCATPNTVAITKTSASARSVRR